MTLPRDLDIIGTYIEVNNYEEVVALREYLELPNDAWSFLEDKAHPLYNQKGPYYLVVVTKNVFGWEHRDTVEGNKSFKKIKAKEIIDPLHRVLKTIREEIKW